MYAALVSTGETDKTYKSIQTFQFFQRQFTDSLPYNIPNTKHSHMHNISLFLHCFRFTHCQHLLSFIINLHFQYLHIASGIAQGINIFMQYQGLTLLILSKSYLLLIFFLVKFSIIIFQTNQYISLPFV